MTFKKLQNKEIFALSHKLLMTPEMLKLENRHTTFETKRGLHTKVDKVSYSEVFKQIHKKNIKKRSELTLSARSLSKCQKNLTAILEKTLINKVHNQE